MDNRKSVASFSLLLLSVCLQEIVASTWSEYCTRPLGLQDERVKNDQLTSVSYYQHFDIGSRAVDMKPEYARLNSNLAWCSNGKIAGNYIAVDFLQTVNLSGIATQGFMGINRYYVETYKIVYSIDGTHWQKFNGTQDNEKVWTGNSDADSVVQNNFTSLIPARYVRLFPISYQTHACVRMEFYGCINYTSGGNPEPVTTPSIPVPTTYHNSNITITSQAPTSVVSHSKDCTRPLGLQDERVKNDQLTSVSYYQHFDIGSRAVDMKPEYARLNSNLAWCSNGKIAGNYIAVDFLQTVNLSGIATQGFMGINRYYVETYKIVYSIDGTHWQKFNGTQDNEKVWTGNSDADSVVQNNFTSLIPARYVRLFPISYQTHACVRMEFYGCINYTSGGNPEPVTTPSIPVPTTYHNSNITITSQAPTSVVSHSKDCTRPLGLQDERVKNDQLTSVSYYQHFDIGSRAVDMKPEYARLNSNLAWCSNGKIAGNYIAVDFLQTVNLSGIATQGFMGINRYYVETYKIVYSIDGTHWQKFNGTQDNEKVWTGNSDADSVVQNNFTSLIPARYVRLFPISYQTHACVRMEFYGCINYTSGGNPEPVTTPSIPVPTTYHNSNITITSQAPTSVVSHSKGNVTVKTTAPITTEAIKASSTKLSTVSWTISSLHVVVAQTARISAGENSSAPGTVVIVLVVVFAVAIIFGVPALMLFVFHCHKRRNLRKQCQRIDKCMCEIPLTDVDSCACSKDVDDYSSQTKYGGDDLQLLDERFPYAV